MKKLFLSFLFFAGTAITFAQVDKDDDRQETDMDRLEQETQPPAQNNLEQNIRIESERAKNEKAAKELAEKEAKEKARKPVVVKKRVKK